MTFKVIILNRLENQEAIATQAHLDVVASVMNRVPKVSKAKFPFECLKAIEELCFDQPFPSDIRISSPAAPIEDEVFYTRLSAETLQKGRWLNSWLLFGTGVDTDYSMYHFVRDQFQDPDEYISFDLEADFDTQANYILLCANSYQGHSIELDIL
jgi:hypothetical protein